MSLVMKIISGTGLLIALYLVISKATDTTKIINSLGGVYASSVKTLQGRG